jgi:hypothetical protein
MTAETVSVRKLGLVFTIFWLHFIAPPYHVDAFVAWRAGVLIAVTAMLAYVFGSIVAGIWNWVHEAG